MRDLFALAGSTALAIAGLVCVILAAAKGDSATGLVGCAFVAGAVALSMWANSRFPPEHTPF